MKKIKLFLAACAAMVGLSAQAQSWTASEVGAGNFYLYNVGKGQFLTRGNGYGTQASVSANSALTVIVEENAGAYKLRTNVNGDGKGLERLGDPVIYTDQSVNKNSTWTFTKVADGSNGPIYTIVSKDNHNGGEGSYMTASADNTIVGPADAVADDYGRWQLVQSWITNSVPVNDANGWTASQTPTFDGSNVCAEYWNKSGASIKQTLSNLPAGSYDLIAVALTRDGMTATLNAGSNTTSIVTVGSGTVNNRTQANTWFNAGNGVNKLEFTHAGGNLEIGLTADNANGDHWLVWRSFVLLYKGLDLSELKAALQAQIDAVPALQGTTTTAAYNAAKNYADGIDMDALTTEEAISTASTELATLVDAAKALQANYTRYNNIKSAAKANASATNTTDADAALAAATTNEAIDAAVATLRAAFLAELPNVTVSTDGLDVTAVMVDNASVAQNTNYWTSYKYPSSPDGGSFGKCSYDECEFYQQNFKFYQILAMTPGTWEFGVTGFHRAGNHSTYFYAGDDKILIPGVGRDVVNTMAQAKTYFDNGNGKVALKFLIETAGNVEIGIDNKDTETDKWTIFRNFTLKYYGPVDYSIYDEQWAAAVAAANAAKTAAANANVTGAELTALDAAIADAPDGSSKANYLEKIQALEAATQTFTAAAASYDQYVAYRAETVSLFGEELAATVAVPTTAAEAAAAVQNLNIAQYNKVASDYTYSLNGLIGDFGSWTGTATVAGEAAEPNYLTNEHWSGATHAYYEQASAGWGNANGWTIKYEKTCKLPAGSYVIKVAARSSVDTQSTVSCSATSTTISLPNVGAASKGITTAGVASWSDSDNFANSNNGFGWQWRFLPFTLTEETEVTMTFYAETSKQYNWMSIADGELLSATDIATAVAYNETANNSIENVDVANVTITRNIKEGFNTVVLPFTLTANQVTAAFGTGTEVYNFSENSADANEITVNFNKGDGSIEANVPVLVKATVASTEQVFNGVQVVAATDAKVAGTNANFVGVYAPATVADGDYFIGKGAVYKSAGATNINAFRAYIDVDNTVAGEVKMFIEDEGIQTAIDAIDAEAPAKGAIFNLAGQRVNNAQKGIYIVGGKKVVIK